MHNPALPVAVGSLATRAEPENKGLYAINDRVRVKVGTFRKSEWVQELAGCGGVISNCFTRAFAPYKIAGINMWLNEDEIEKVGSLDGLKEIPVKHRDSPGTTRVSTYVRPVIEYISLKDIAEV